METERAKPDNQEHYYTFVVSPDPNGRLVATAHRYGLLGDRRPSGTVRLVLSSTSQDLDGRSLKFILASLSLEISDSLRGIIRSERLAE